MKKIAYTGLNGETVIVTPNIGFRNAYRALATDGVTVEAREALEAEFGPADRLLGPVPWNEEAVVEWAETEDEFIQRIILKDVPLTAKNLTVLKEPVPKDRTFRDAWVISDGRVVVDMPKAREIHLKRIRWARDARLKALDGPWMRAFARRQIEEAAEIESEREMLRQLPQTISLEYAKTPEELAELWPEELR